MKLNVLALGVGFVVTLIALSVLEILIWELLLQNLVLPLSVDEFIYSYIGEVVISYLLLAMSLVLGGYVSAWIAKEKYITHGLWVGIIFLLGSFLIGLSFDYSTMLTTTLYDVAIAIPDAAAILALAAIGGYLRSRPSKEKHREMARA